jgi:hypothetical protein
MVAAAAVVTQAREGTKDGRISEESHNLTRKGRMVFQGQRNGSSGWGRGRGGGGEGKGTLESVWAVPSQSEVVSSLAPFARTGAKHLGKCVGGGALTTGGGSQLPV